MIPFDYKNDGKLTRGFFYEKWEQVPFDVFIKWQVLFNDINALLGGLKDLGVLANKLQSEAQQLKDNGVSAGLVFSSNKVQQEQLHTKFTEYKSEMTVLEIKAISLFTDVPPHVLASLNRKNDILGFELNEHWLDSQPDSILFFKARFWHLTAANLPDLKPANTLMWQTKTDEEIADLQKQYNSLTWFQKTIGKDKKIIKDYRSAVCGEWRIINIWQQSTYANSQFIENAKIIVAEMERGEWQNLDKLVAMVLVESSTHEQLLTDLKKQTDAGKYFENYATEYKKLFERNMLLLFGQKNKLTVGHILQIKAFFLHSLKR